MKFKKYWGLLLCGLMILGLIGPMTQTAQAATPITIGQNQTVTKTTGPAASSYTVTLTGASSQAQLRGKSEWISYTKKNGKYEITAAFNPNASTRKGSIMFYEGNKTWTLQINQTSNSLTGVPTSYAVSNEAKTYSFNVTRGAGPVKSDSSNKAWLTTYVSGTTVYYTVKANETGTSSRTANLTVTVGNITKTCKVTQNKARTDISFPYQSDIDADNWTSTRIAKLSDFYTKLINGAQNRGDTKAKDAITRAKYLTVFSWKCLKDVTWTYSSGKTYLAGHTYYGAPYQQATNDSPTDYIGYEITPQTFVTRLQNANDKFYTKRTTSSGNMGPYYGTDCSGFVSYCLGLSSRKTSGTLYSDFAKPGAIQSNISSGDVLYKSNHVMLVAAVIRENGTLKGVVLLESRARTTASGRNIYVYYDNDATLRKLFNNADFSTCRDILQNVIDKSNTGTIANFINAFPAGTYTLIRKK